MEQFKIALGMTVVCGSMGIEGTTFARSDCLDGSKQYRVLGKDSTGTAIDMWIDESLLTEPTL